VSYSFVEAMSNPFRASDRVVRGAVDELTQLHPPAGRAFIEVLSSPALGSEVRSARSSWVRRLRSGDKDYFVKTYDYLGPRAALRGAFRNTFLRPSRAAREWDALAWLEAERFQAPAPVCVLERRQCGFLRRAVLVSRAWPGEQVDLLMARSTTAERQQLAAAVIELVVALHQRGFRDGNLDLRNLLARAGADGWLIAKLDSPRWHLTAAGRSDDRLARADWARLMPQLLAYVPDAMTSRRSRG
jgi:Lipopolysaccharide kinase (Kdo/WaaP) family